MSGPNGPEEEHESKNSDRDSWAEKVTIAQAARAVVEAVKVVDKVIWIFKPLYCDAPPGQYWPIRSFYAWLAIATPWGLYLLWLEFVQSGPGETIWPEGGYPLPTTTIIGFFVIVLPISLAIAITHRRELAYSEAYFAHGLRVGGYSLAALLVLKKFLGF